jgi:N-acetylneuraminic acid mutarotase
MKNSIFYYLVALVSYITTVHGYFYVPNFMNSLPFKGGMSSAQRNNSLYLFGGENATTTYTNDLYKLTQTSDSYTWEIVQQINPPPGTIYGQAYTTADSENLVLLGGTTNDTTAAVKALQIYVYNYASQTWTANTSNTDIVNQNDTSILFNRESFSATYNAKTQQTYVFGGALPGLGAIFSDFRVLDANFKATTLNSPNVGRYGHTASLLR